MPLIQTSQLSENVTAHYSYGPGLLALSIHECEQETISLGYDEAKQLRDFLLCVFPNTSTQATVDVEDGAKAADALYKFCEATFGVVPKMAAANDFWESLKEAASIQSILMNQVSDRMLRDEMKRRGMLEKE